MTIGHVLALRLPCIVIFKVITFNYKTYVTNSYLDSQLGLRTQR